MSSSDMDKRGESLRERPSFIKRLESKDEWSQAFKPLLTALGWFEKRKLFATILLFGFVFLKVIIVAKGSIPIALGIVQTAGPASIVVGSLLSGLPLVAAALLVVWVRQAYVDKTPPSIALALLALIVCTFMTPWFLLLPSLVFSLIAAAMSALSEPATNAARVGLAITIVAVLYATWAVMYGVWVPREVISLDSGRSDVGYVLSDDGTWVSMLRSDHSILVRYKEDEVMGRAVCQEHPVSSKYGTIWSRWLASLIDQSHTTSSQSLKDCPPPRKSSP
jgi:hypothetical protein